MFDLEKSIAAWRRTFEHNRVFSPEDLEELERHLRDHTAYLVSHGRGAEEAFQEALAGIGDSGSISDEYQKVFWEKIKHQRSLRQELHWRISMLSSYLKTALRNLRRHKVHTTVNVFGLAVAVAAVIILGLFVAYERSFDHFHEKTDRIFTLTEEATRSSGEIMTYRYTRTPALPTLLQEMPEVENGARVLGWGTPSMGYNDRRYDVDLVCADSGFFDVFSFPVLRGEARSALTRPDAVVLTESTAKRIFGEEDPVGKTLDYSFGEGTFTVTAIVADPPPNSTIQFEMLGAFLIVDDIFSPQGAGGWSNSNMPTYVLLREGIDPASLVGQFDAFKERHYTPYPDTKINLILQPLTTIHAEETDNGPILAALTLIATAILLIASINFTNLTTAQALDRAREVGMRKVVGAYRLQLAGQFLGEALLTCGLALILGVLLTWLALPAFNNTMDLPLRLDLTQYVPLLITLWIVLGLTAGLYPALYLSGLRPVQSLRGRLAHKAGGQRVRQGLVIAQFGLAVFLIAGMLVVWQQIQYMKTQDVGFDRENVIVMPVRTAALGGREAAGAPLASIREELLNHAVVRSVSFSQLVPGRYNFDFNTYFPNGDESQGIRMRQVWGIDARYFETYHIDLVEGESFSAEAPSRNENRVIINHAAMEHIERGISDVRLYRGSAEGQSFEIAGVVENFHYQSLANEVEPLIHYYGGEDPGRYNYLSVRLHPGKAAEGVALLQSYWERLYPGLDFEYFFIDAEFDSLYRTQERLGLVATAFAALAVLIACLGLLALAAFSVRLRTKEIGVRKVLGATAPQVVLLLAREFAWLVLVAAVLAAPGAYFVMRRWLEDFAYHIDVGPGVLAGAGILALVLAMGTVGYQAIRAATADPVKSLRYE